MQQSNFNPKNDIQKLIFEYEAMSRKGTVAFLEEKVFFDLADVYQSTNRAAQALKVIEDGLSQYAYSSELHFRKAQLLANLNDKQAALDAIDTALALSPSNQAIYQFKNELLGVDNASNEILQSIENSFSDSFISRSRIDEQFENVDELYNRLKKKLRRYPNNEVALNKILFCVEINQRYEDSVKFHLELINQNSYSHLAWYNLGQAYYCLKQYQNAADAFEYSFLANGDFLLAYKDFSKVCFELNDYDRALQAFQDLLTQTEPDFELLVSIGECYEMKENYSVAYLYYNKAIKLEKECSYAHYRIGECLAKEQKWFKAISAYEQAIYICNNRESYHTALGKAYAKVNMNEDAFAAFEEATDMAPDVVSLWMNIINFLMDTKDYEQALSKIEEAKMYVGDLAKIQYANVACLYRMEKRVKAKKQLIQVLNKHYQDFELLFKYVPEAEKNHGILSLIGIFNQN